MYIYIYILNKKSLLALTNISVFYITFYSVKVM